MVSSYETYTFGPCEIWNFKFSITNVVGLSLLSLHAKCEASGVPDQVRPEGDMFQIQKLAPIAICTKFKPGLH